MARSNSNDISCELKTQIKPGFFYIFLINSKYIKLVCEYLVFYIFIAYISMNYFLFYIYIYI
jgi:hypothetical protein